MAHQRKMFAVSVGLQILLTIQYLTRIFFSFRGKGGRGNKNSAFVPIF